MDLSVTLGRLHLRNPVLVASGTFGYAREMAGVVDFARLGGVIPKTVTRQPRAGNPPPRTVETPSGMLNAIGLDNDGIEHFIHHHLPYLRTLPTAIIANIAGKNEQEFVDMAEMIGRESGLAALELNLSCPNVAGGVDFAVDPEVTRRVVRRVREVCPLPLIAKLTPNVTNIVAHRSGGGRRRGGRRVAGEHVRRHGGRLAAAPADPRQRHRRPERAGDQAAGAAAGMADGAERKDPDYRRRRHCDAGRRDGISGGGGERRCSWARSTSTIRRRRCAWSEGLPAALAQLGAESVGEVVGTLG